MDKIIKEFTTDKFVSVVLWDSQTLQEIHEKSGELADHSEYQVHYWSLKMQKELLSAYMDGEQVDAKSI